MPRSPGRRSGFRPGSAPAWPSSWLCRLLAHQTVALPSELGILREAGIPIESVRGAHGGYRVGRGLRLPPLVFSAAEALGLVMAVLDGHHDASDPTDPVGGALGKILRALPEPVADFDPVAVLEEHLAVGWEYDVEVVIDAPADTVARRLPRALGQLEPLGPGTSRLVGSTSNPVWYAEQLAAVPAPYQIVKCPELREAARVLGQRLLAASDVGGGE